jgi:hypothetical protein
MMFFEDWQTNEKVGCAILAVMVLVSMVLLVIAVNQR